jgi:hypothetical protein
MKPRLFIGSSSEGLPVGQAIQKNLNSNAECTLWSQGVFGISGVGLTSLLNELHKCDFGIFVCSADDMLTMRKKTTPIVRDNVLFELGMFIGYLGVGRTFYLVPDDAKELHLPSDLQGITYGLYEANRVDGNLQQATGPFCSDIMAKVRSDGYFHGEEQHYLDELSLQYACCEWIEDFPKTTAKQKLRWERKFELFYHMVSFCKSTPVNKRYLAERHFGAFFDPNLKHLYEKIALFAAVTGNPEVSDISFIIRVSLDSLPDGQARINALYSAHAISEKFDLSSDDVSKIKRWLESVVIEEPTVKEAQDVLRSSLARHKG